MDNIPVACYDDLKPEQALHAYMDEFIPELISRDILIDSNGTATLKWHGVKYDAKTDLVWSVFF
jgi:hypothetical protein